MVTSREPWSEATAAWLIEALRSKPLLAYATAISFWRVRRAALWATTQTAASLGPPGCFCARNQKRTKYSAGFRRLFRSRLPRSIRLELPPGAVLLASNAHDPHHAFRSAATRGRAVPSRVFARGRAGLHRAPRDELRAKARTGSVAASVSATPRPIRSCTVREIVGAIDLTLSGERAARAPRPLSRPSTCVGTIR